MWTCVFIASHIHHFKADFTMNWNLKIHRHCWLDEVNNPCLLKDFEFLSVGKIRSPWRIDWFLSNFTIGCNVVSKTFIDIFLATILNCLVFSFGCIFPNDEFWRNFITVWNFAGILYWKCYWFELIILRQIDENYTLKIKQNS